jgi:predicted TIM-barrel fold metal-dependent hydrolase
MEMIAFRMNLHRGKADEYRRRHDAIWPELVLETLDAFGIARAMFASNFPVDRLFGSYVDTCRAFVAITADLSAAEKQALFAANAERIYRI